MAISFSPPFEKNARARGAGVTAVLGPTNTGKTHLAIERMLAHSSGMIGLPLRLLAREVYNKVAAAAGPAAVALVTGEEKVKPPNPRFWVSTVEAMPRDLDVAFLAVDEIQLGSDFERGHVFTDRMLNRRGREETLVLGAATMRPLVERLLPGAHIVSRPRLSQLTYAGEKKITRLPRRSAIVAFSAEEVYAIAELIRRQRGGAAVVLGALSPRTRNAQVDLYQSGDVDYLVATDAIGMGLNLDVDHVAFASDRKFDGYQYRKLAPSELAQIAGRAGRATRNGTFGTTGRCPPFEHELVNALESHAFEPIKVLQWRNSALDFTSIGALQATLAQTPTDAGLTRAPVGEDILVLEHAARDDAVRALASSRAAVERLWDVCQVPDYRKVSPAAHAELAVTLYGFLSRNGTIPVDWFAGQVAQANRTDGDIDTLSTRIAHIRTWTFAANRPDWLDDPEHWQEEARAVEDKLSDALHQRLIERFVDRRTSVLMRRLRENTMLETEVTKTGEVVVEGHPIGRLEGFQFAAAASAGGPEGKALRAAAQKALAGEIEQRAARLGTANNDQFVLTSDGTLRWMGDAVGKLVPGEDVLRPRVRLIADEQLSGSARDTVQSRLDLWVKAHSEKLLGPLLQLAQAEDVTGIGRGVAFQLSESLGVLERHKVADEVKNLDQTARATLRKYGVRFGAYHIYLPMLLKPAPRALAAHLWALKHGGPELKGLDEIAQLAASGRTSMPADKDVPKAMYRTAGYRVCGERAVRVDILERLADLIRPALAWRPNSAGEKPDGAVDGSCFTVTTAMTSLAGTSGEDFASVLRALGYRLDRRPKPADPPPAASAESATASEPSEAEVSAGSPDAPDALDGGLTALAEGGGALDVDAANGEGDSVFGSAFSESASDGSPGAAATEPEDVAGVGGPAAEDVVPIVAAHETGNRLDGNGAGVETDAAIVTIEAKSDAAAAGEPILIEVWRPGRGEDRRRRGGRAQERRPAHSSPRRAPAEAVPEAPTEAAPGTAHAPAPAAEPRPDGARHGGRRFDRPRGARSGAPGEPRRDKPSGGWRRSDGERENRAEKHPPRPARERREKPIDPDSPFAKLAALKAQLEANAKERS